MLAVAGFWVTFGIFMAKTIEQHMKLPYPDNTIGRIEQQRREENEKKPYKLWNSWSMLSCMFSHQQYDHHKKGTRESHPKGRREAVKGKVSFIFLHDDERTANICEKK
jgi:hypothetical protein